MEWMWMAQVTVNFLFLLFVLFSWRERRTERIVGARDRKEQTERYRLAVARLEELAEHQGVQADAMKQQMEERLSLLGSVGKQAEALLQRSQQEVARRIPTLEEHELAELATISGPSMMANAAPEVSSVNRSKQVSKAAGEIRLSSVLCGASS